MNRNFLIAILLLTATSVFGQKKEGSISAALEVWNQGDYELFINVTDSLFNQDLDPAELAGIQVKRGEAFDRLELPVKAVQSFEKAITLSDDSDVKGSAALNIADIYFEQKSYSRALEYYAESLRNFETTSNDRGAQVARFKTAMIHSRTGNAEMALSLLKSIANNPNSDIVRVGMAEKEIGQVFFSIAQFDSARHYLNHSTQLLGEFGMTSEQLENMELLLKCYHAENDTENATEIAEKAVDLAIRTGNKRSAALFLQRLSLQFKENDKYREATRYAEMAKSYVPLLTTENAIAYYFNLADLYVLTNENTEALLAFHEAQMLADKEKDVLWLEKIARKKSTFYADQGRIKDAYTELLIADSLQESNHQLVVSQLRRDAGAAKFNQEVYPRVANDRRSQQEQNLFSRLQNILIVGLIFFTIIILLLLREFTQKRKLSKILEWKVYKRTRELRKANKELNTYIYKSSHDLRTPLTSIKSLLRLLEKEEHNASTKKYLGLINSCTDQMDDILLNLSRAVDYKKVDVRVEQIDFNKLRYQILDKELSGREAINLQWEIEENGAFYSDFKLLKVILEQTIENAVAYRKGNPEDFCRVKIQTDTDGAEVTIEDNGQGISEKVRDKVFDMFVKGTHKSTGAGLGLYLVRIANEKIRGKIKLYSEENEGSKLTFSLPNLN